MDWSFQGKFLCGDILEKRLSQGKRISVKKNVCYLIVTLTLGLQRLRPFTGSM